MTITCRLSSLFFLWHFSKRKIILQPFFPNLFMNCAFQLLNIWISVKLVGESVGNFLFSIFLAQKTYISALFLDLNFLLSVMSPSGCHQCYLLRNVFYLSISAFIPLACDLQPPPSSSSFGTSLGFLMSLDLALVDKRNVSKAFYLEQHFCCLLGYFYAICHMHFSLICHISLPRIAALIHLSSKRFVRTY